MDQRAILKALADETRMKLLVLLLERDLCGKALARKTGVSEAAVSQHLKVLKEAGLILGEKEGHHTHYEANRALLRELAGEMEGLAATEQQPCSPEEGGCPSREAARCSHKRSSCHGHYGEGRRSCAHHSEDHKRCGCHSEVPQQ